MKCSNYQNLHCQKTNTDTDTGTLSRIAPGKRYTLHVNWPGFKGLKNIQSNDTNMMEEVQLKEKPEDVAPPFTKLAKQTARITEIQSYNNITNKKTNTTRSKQKVALFHKTCTKRTGFTLWHHSNLNTSDYRQNMLRQ